MEKISNFFKNKAIGYFMVAADIVIALVLTIVFFMTYKGAMANNAASLVPETIAIFLIAGMIVEAVVLVIPQYRFVHIAGMVMFALALFKEILLIPNLIADEINNVHYQGGNLSTQVFYLVTLIIICAVAIAAAFIGFYKQEAEAQEEMKIKKDGIGNIIKVACCGVVTLAAVLTSSLIAADMQRKMNIAGDDTSFNPITAEIKEIAEKYEYDFKPGEVIIQEQDNYDFSGMNSKVPDSATRADHHMVYYFEGAYAEGYQGDYSETYAYLCLWDDGLFGGKINSTSVRGYWFNSSIAEGKEGTVKDCLKMVSNVDHYDSIIAQEATGFYQYNAYAYLGFSWGTRSMILNGYEYYPEVALAIDPSNTGTNFAVGEPFDRDSWVALRILKNLSYSSVFKASEVKWTVPSDMLDENKNFKAAGDYEIKAAWNSMEASVTVHVADAQ